MPNNKASRVSRCAACEPLESRLLLSAGDIDTSFGELGLATAPIQASAAAMALQSDRKIIVAGTSQISSKRTLLVSRLNGDGSLDSSFADGGQFVLAVGGDPAQSGTNDADIVIDSDGTMVIVAGLSLIRLTGSGQLDAGFGDGDGIIPSATELTDVAMDASGNILAGGGTMVHRYLPDGTIDSSFADEGTFDVAPVVNDAYILQDINMTPAGRIFILGQVGTYADPSNYDDYTDASAVQLLPSGALDPGFSDDGHDRIDLIGGNWGDYPTCSIVQPDGKIIVSEAVFGGYVFRMNPDGSDDPTFGNTYSSARHSIGFEGVLNSLALQPDGKIVGVSGNYYESGDPQYVTNLQMPSALVRLTSTGQYDTTFSFDGVAHLPFYRHDDNTATVVAVDGSGRIVVGGAYFPRGSRTHSLYVARYQATGPTNSDFQQLTGAGMLVVTGTDGRDTIEVFPPSGTGEARSSMVELRFNDELFFYGSIDGVSITAGGGNDVVGVYMPFASTIFGEAGNDRLILGTTLGNLAKKDVYAFGMLNGGDGDDYLVDGLGRDTLIGGTGIDTADYYGHNQGSYYDARPLFISLDDKANDGLLGESDNVHGDVENIIGSTGDDHLIGNSGANRLQGEQGNDTLEGGPGNDTLDGGAGADALIGGAGNDWVSYADRGVKLSIYLVYSKTGSGAVGEGDQISPRTIENAIGGKNNDLIFGSNGNNVFMGGDGQDTLYGNGGNDRLYGNGGKDKLLGGAGNDYLSGGGGRDTLFGDIGRDRVYGGPAADLILAHDRSRDTVYGGSGRDVAYLDLSGRKKDYNREIESIE